VDHGSKHFDACPEPGAGTYPGPAAGTNPEPGAGTYPGPAAGTNPEPGAGTYPEPGVGTYPEPGAGTPTRPALVHRLLAWLQHWRVAHVVADETGVGQGMVSWLVAALGERRVTGYNFSGTGQKAALGSAFLSLVETGRFKYWNSAHAPGDSASPAGGWSYDPTIGETEPGSVSPDAIALTDAAWFWHQVRACTYEVPPDGRFDRDLRWGVHPAHRTDTATGPQPTHDDRLISAALVAELDRLLRTGAVILGTAESAVIPQADPLAGMGEIF
ncbi:MAG TPA: hypothetical protein VLL51_05105, partial [Gemmatimonadales bacterium]|nr:hypothetical protein [Gemmatimonadales bacterium]